MGVTQRGGTSGVPAQELPIFPFGSPTGRFLGKAKEGH